MGAQCSRYLRLVAGPAVHHALPSASADNVEERFLGKRSTNLHHLAEDPLRVLFSSASGSKVAVGWDTWFSSPSFMQRLSVGSGRGGGCVLSSSPTSEPRTSAKVFCTKVFGTDTWRSRRSTLSTWV